MKDNLEQIRKEIEQIKDKLDSKDRAKKPTEGQFQIWKFLHDSLDTQRVLWLSIGCDLLVMFLLGLTGKEWVGTFQ